MAEEQASEKIDLSEVMLAMDVVDTLRHQRSIVERELQSEDREADLIEKLRKIYADQGLEVSDEVIAEGVKAMREERFAYRPPPGGLKTTLARMYVNRGRWAKRAMWLLIVAAAVWAGYRYLYVMPAERGRSRLAREINAQVSDQKERIATLQIRISAATGDLDKVLQSVPAAVLPSARRLSDGARQSLSLSARQLGAADKLGPVAGIDPNNLETYATKIQQRLTEQKGIIDRAQNDLENAEAAIGSIRSLGTDFNDLDSLRAEALKVAREKGVAEKIEALYNNALSAVKSGDLETAKDRPKCTAVHARHAGAGVHPANRLASGNAQRRLAVSGRQPYGAQLLPDRGGRFTERSASQASHHFRGRRQGARAQRVGSAGRAAGVRTGQAGQAARRDCEPQNRRHQEKGIPHTGIHGRHHGWYDYRMVGRTRP